MPVAARLSRRFYEAIGDDAANDLVNWMNAVDVTYRNELLQHNEANFTRFVVLLDARITTLRDEMDRRFAEFESRIGKRFVDLEQKFEKRFVDLEQRLDRVELHLDKIKQRLETLDVGLDARFAKFEARMMKWMLVFWATTITTILLAR